MEGFLKNLQLPEPAIKIYLKSLGSTPLTYYELYSIVPTVPPDDFNKYFNDLSKRAL